VVLARKPLGVGCFKPPTATTHRHSRATPARLRRTLSGNQITRSLRRPSRMQFATAWHTMCRFAFETS
jgi:hypothetical protein